MSTLLEWAIYYQKRGFGVIPLKPRDKRPALPWEPWQRERPDAAKLREWFHGRNALNIAIVTGAVSGVVVLDVDGTDGEASLQGKHLPPTPVVLTGTGRHLYFKHPGRELRTLIRRLPGLDVKGDGGYCVAPPSIHPTGRRYRWAPGLTPSDVDLAPMPDWLLDLARGERQGERVAPEDWARIIRQGAGPGGRHPTMVQVAGHLLGKGVDPRVVVELLLAFNEARCAPPKPAAEVVGIVRDLWRRDQEKGARRNGGS